MHNQRHNFCWTHMFAMKDNADTPRVTRVILKSSRGLQESPSKRSDADLCLGVPVQQHDTFDCHSIQSKTQIERRPRKSAQCPVSLVTCHFNTFLLTRSGATSLAYSCQIQTSGSQEGSISCLVLRSSLK